MHNKYTANISTPQGAVLLPGKEPTKPSTGTHLKPKSKVNSTSRKLILPYVTKKAVMPATYKWIKPTNRRTLVVVGPSPHLQIKNKLTEPPKPQSKSQPVARFNPRSLHRLVERNVENFVVVWLDSKNSNENGDFRHSIEQLRSIVNDVKIFIDIEACRAMLYQIQNEKIFLIVSGGFGETFVPEIYDLPQL